MVGQQELDDPGAKPRVGAGFVQQENDSLEARASARTSGAGSSSALRASQRGMSSH
ncbi:hypothetical protein [Nocardia jinanensis]|uniref:hypothetical protein n=1 Tax=Nocardia jinanensis TaxID=382504 RepID=UPI00166BF56D|nr:hypothetical protein [Nocardia jinanensis]